MVTAIGWNERQVATLERPTSTAVGPQPAAAPLRAARGEEAPVQPLTAREREVLALVAEGYANKEIGGLLGISERTVKNHLTYIMTKLGAWDRTHAVVKALRLGWLAL